MAIALGAEVGCKLDTSMRLRVDKNQRCTCLPFSDISKSLHMCRLKEDITRWIGVWYNQRRQHLSLGYMPPVEYERSRNVA